MFRLLKEELRDGKRQDSSKRADHSADEAQQKQGKAATGRLFLYQLATAAAL